MEESIQSSSTLADCLPPVYSLNALEMPGSRCADSFCNQIEGENGVAGRLILSKGQPPPPYSENIKTFQADVSFSDPPKYDDARSSTTTHVTANVDKPLDINLVYVTSRQAAFNVVELVRLYGFVHNKLLLERNVSVIHTHGLIKYSTAQEVKKVRYWVFVTYAN